MDNLLTEYQIIKIFNINPITLRKLVNEKKIPFTNQGSRPRFDMDVISNWIINNSIIEEDEDIRLKRIQAEWQEKSPELFSALRSMDIKVIAHSDAQKNPKRYNLIKRQSKKFGFLYYVRYIDKGKLIPSKWNTHTNMLQEAEKFAQENRDQILSKYYSKHTLKNVELYSTLEEYYKAGSPYLERDKNRNRILGEKTRSVYYHFMKKKFIPYLQENNIKTFEKIEPPIIAKFQDYLLAEGMEPQSINRYLSSVNCVFNQLLIRGIIKENAFDRIKALKMGDKSTEVRGCHDIDRMKGVFNTQWDDVLSYLLCLLIYSTGIRNSEIEKIQANDLIRLDGIHFVDVKKSKTRNGIRFVPLHDFVYGKIQEYIKKTGKRGEDYIFSAHGGPNQSTAYKNANLLLGKKLKLSDNETEIEKELEKQNISFYSGRHFWKTLMSSEGLGDDIEEFFMGHKVSGDVSKNYNHKDKQGKDKLLEKAKEVFTILDKKLFA
ncbi:MAG: site-specific integrase [Bacteroidales bacterium]|jgi:integrase|nr:site-specific integrase [Bacteroidales bacterium]